MAEIDVRYHSNTALLKITRHVPASVSVIDAQCQGEIAPERVIGRNRAEQLRIQDATGHLGQLLGEGTDFPQDLSEADRSQAGKTIRLKMVHAIYGETPYIVTNREGGVGSIDESITSTGRITRKECPGASRATRATTTIPSAKQKTRNIFLRPEGIFRSQPSLLRAASLFQQATGLESRQTFQGAMRFYKS
jgi:hypothetical protein